MQTLRIISIILVLQWSLPICAQNLLPYDVFKATKGVILKSFVRNDEFFPVRGTKLYERDTFLLKDNRYVVKVKDRRNGEVFTWNRGKGLITPLQIVSLQRYDNTKKFFSFLASIAEETGFDTKPVRISQGVLQKGGPENKPDSLSLNIATNIRNSIADSIYVDNVRISKVYSPDSTFYYLVQNCDTINYAMVLYTVTKDSVFRHDDILWDEWGRIRPDALEYLRLIPNHSLKLDYFSLDGTEEDDRTCYVLLFNPSDFYISKENGTYDFLIDWKTILKELIFQGNENRVLLIKKYE